MAAAPPPATSAPEGGRSPWAPLERDYDLEYKQLSLKPRFQKTTTHPLMRGLTKKAQQPQDGTKEGIDANGAQEQEQARQEERQEEKQKEEIDDPLRMIAAASSSSAPGSGAKAAVVFDDPLRMLASPSASPVEASASASVPGDRGETPSSAAVATGGSSDNESAWSALASRVLQKYTTNKRIAVTATFLEEEKKAPEKNQPVDTLTSRLEQLETDAESDTAKSYMTQKEYIAHIEAQHGNLKRAWENGERVLSLKIAIQCAKLLGDPKVPQFYPSMYVLLSNILTTFGRLVYERIKEKGLPSSKRNARSSDNFRSSDVSLEAKETCRNWFYKIACIRELLPRLYVEMALMSCQRFLEDDPFPSMISRLSKGIRGVGDPLVAAYCRCFLASRSMEVLRFVSPPTAIRDALLGSFDDFLFTFRGMRIDRFRNIGYVREEKISVDDYIDLFSPSLEWLLYNIGQRSSEDVFFALLQQYKECCNSSMVLMHVLSSFSPRFVSAHAKNMTELIREADESGHVSRPRLYLTLGRALVGSAPPREQLLSILNDVWKVVTKIQAPEEYCDIASVFVEYLLLHFTEREVNIFLKDVIKHVKADSAYKQLQPQLHVIISKVLMHSKNLERTLSMDNFLPLLDLLEKQDAKIEAAKHILGALEGSTVKVSDPVLLHTLFDIARSLHDSVDSLSFYDERRQISNHIVAFIRKIDFGRDLEKQLSTYVECRAAFTNLEAVTSELVVRTSLLAVRAHQIMRGRHNKKTLAFVKACLAYCHITIPSLEDVFTRLHLFLTCGEVALVNQLIVQGEAFLKAAISLIPEVPVHREYGPSKRLIATEDDMLHFVGTFASFLLLFPGHPKHGPFYLIKGLLNAIQQYEPWKQGKPATIGKTRVYLGFLQLFCTYAQRKYPYHCDKVDSNDSLYGGNEDFMKQLQVFIDLLVDEVLAFLHEIGEKADLTARKEQGILALEYANLLISFMEMNPRSATLVVNLYKLAQQGRAVPEAFLASTLAHIQQKKGTWYADIAQKIMTSSSTAAPTSSSQTPARS